MITDQNVRQILNRAEIPWHYDANGLFTVEGGFGALAPHIRAMLLAMNRTKGENRKERRDRVIRGVVVHQQQLTAPRPQIRYAPGVR